MFLGGDRATVLMGGPGGGGGGYATTGSIGATEGSGGDAVDDCGLRFLLAMRHHTCLLRSLPLAQRAQLERKVCFTSFSVRILTWLSRGVFVSQTNQRRQHLISSLVVAIILRNKI